MRLHHLTLTAFGPFGGTVHVDFAQLAAGGVFLLHGPTGAGKTAILDAVCYALYGSVPGSRQQHLQALRSHHAPACTPTEVSLDLTVENRRLDITRRPEQTRPKKRGHGHTTDKAVTLLREFQPDTGTWRPLSRSHQEAARELGQLLGMNRDQFCQVVLLPQGDFARFLRAGADERARLLGRLFDTSRFAAAEAHLAGLRNRGQKEVRTADEGILSLLHRVEQAAGPGAARTAHSVTTGELTAGDPQLASDALGYAAVARCVAAEQLDQAQLTLQHAEAHHRAAQRRLGEETELARLQEQHQDARRRAALLADTSGTAADYGDQLSRARAADTVAPALELREAATAAHTRAHAAETTARAALPPDQRDVAASHLAAEEHAVRQELGLLAAARRAEERHAHLTAELAALDERDEQESARWHATRSAADTAEATCAQQRERLERARAAAARAAVLTTERHTAESDLAAARDAARLISHVRHLAEEQLTHRVAASAAHERWLDCREQRLRGYAAELAADLRPGSPCAVCGATKHPDPAPGETARASRRDEETARAAYTEADARSQESAQRLALLREEHAAHAARSGGRPVAELEARATELIAAYEAAQREAADTDAASADLVTAEEELRALQETERQLREDHAARASTRAALTAERTALTAEAAQARGDDPSVAARATRLSGLAGRLAAASAAARTAELTAGQRKDADARPPDAAYRAGFATPEEAAAALLPRHQQQQFQRHLDQRQAEETAVAVVLNDSRTAEAGRRPPADPAAADATAEAALTALREAAASETAARERRTALARLSTALTGSVRRHLPLREHSDRVTRLAHLTAGTAAENTYRMRLETYVLTARLEQVAHAATSRLRYMSAGRYTLTHSDIRSGRARSGLGLRVTDAWTGRDRDTATLSGGESFVVSLALALGLADVVAEESGGRRLDTLFIDEGFGTLDEQALDEVLDVLDTLRERDRIVGIVSHVPELRARFPVRLEVTKNRDGSAVRHHTTPLEG